ncbi:hypothetical protein [Niallia sp. FSL W8-1348]|uniref:hypothetical protein n=1 Tax=Niallia sp. FSL W8-1348 TaxID=2954656 RepID=UPI0030F88FD7
MDGQKIYTGLDLYNTGNYVYSLDVFPLRTNDYYNRGYGKHVVKVVLTGANASAITPTVSNRRLQFISGYVFDGR